MIRLGPNMFRYSHKKNQGPKSLCHTKTTGKMELQANKNKHGGQNKNKYTFCIKKKNKRMHLLVFDVLKLELMHFDLINPKIFVFYSWELLVNRTLVDVGRFSGKGFRKVSGRAQNWQVKSLLLAVK